MWTLCSEHDVSILLRASPGSAGILTHRPLGRFSLVGRTFFSGGALARTNAHLLFAENHGGRSLGFVTPLQKSAAHQRQLLQTDAISSNQNKIGLDRTSGPYAILAEAFECEHTESEFLGETRQNELHLRV